MKQAHTTAKNLTLELRAN